MHFSLASPLFWTILHIIFYLRENSLWNWVILILSFIFLLSVAWGPTASYHIFYSIVLSLFIFVFLDFHFLVESIKFLHLLLRAINFHLLLNIQLLCLSLPLIWFPFSGHDRALTHTDYYIMIFYLYTD